MGLDVYLALIVQESRVLDPPAPPTGLVVSGEERITDRGLGCFVRSLATHIDVRTKNAAKL